MINGYQDKLMNKNYIKKWYVRSCVCIYTMKKQLTQARLNYNYNIITLKLRFNYIIIVVNGHVSLFEE